MNKKSFANFIKSKTAIIIFALAIVCVAAPILLLTVFDAGTPADALPDTHIDAEPSAEVLSAEAAEPSATPSPTPAPVVYTVGYDGSIVTDIQSRLTELGYIAMDEPTTVYSEKMASDVAIFQSKHGLEPTGEADEFTLSVLFSDAAKPYYLTVGDTVPEVEPLSSRLTQLGFMDGSVTVFDDTMQQGVRTFQEYNGLTVTGTVGADTREALYSSEAISLGFSVGDESEAIAGYQSRLKQLGYLQSAADGKYGAATEDAVRLFQSRNGLIEDGNLGPETCELLNSDAALPYYLGLGDSGDDVTALQKRLIKLGYNTKSTGYFGSETESALKSFQKRNDLTADGKAGVKTLAVLNSSSAVKAPATSTPKPPTATPTKRPSGGTTTTPAPVPDDSQNGTSSDKIEEFIAVAKTKIGCKYVLGAKGPDQFDCSGFVFWCLNQVGVKQGYMTSRGWAATTKYPVVTKMSDLKRGDIIVYDGDTYGHVGIYLGDGKMIDASSTDGKIRITSSNIMTNSYWKSHFIKGCRVF